MARRKNSGKENLPAGDDGRTIVSMNVEGMPWYVPGETGDRQQGTENREQGTGGDGRRFELTREETRFFTWGALKAALLVVGAMCLGIVLFVLFCQFVWFR
ncbi:MAG: hypothetical protein Q4C10_14575 [Clostridia bacterium]|nr:hypothetical protein [Clostridia bacterium]